MNFYQKYRPTKIADLDLVQVRQALAGLVSSQSALQAFLFVGPRGAGKTSAARILARTVNCLKLKNGEACGECEACKVSAAGGVDIIEIDAASHRGIDDIRELRERVKLAPVSLPKKIYIIDEVHMLTKEAFNALLKTLEEPPEFVVFVLCTTEAQKIPETIASRCSKVVFAKACQDEVVRSLMKVVKGEGLEIDKKAIDLLAESVDGSFREGHKILEQLVAGGGKKIGESQVRQVLGLVDGGLVKLIFGAVDKGQASQVMELVKKAEADGINPISFVKACLKFLRQKYEKEVMGGGGGRLTGNLITALTEAGGKLKQALEPFLLLEVVLLEVACGVEKMAEEKKETVKLDKPEKVIDKPEKTVIDAQVSRIREGWGSLIANLKSKNHSVASLLRSARPVKLANDCLEVEVFYQFHKDQLEQEVRRRMVEEGMGALWGIKKVRFNLGDNRARVATKADEELVRNAKEVFV